MISTNVLERICFTLQLLVALALTFIIFSLCLGSGIECGMSPRGRENSVKMLTFLVDHFEKHNISYWLTSGTLLGALRIQDILNVEWEDVDVSIFASDVPKLVSSFASSSPSQLTASSSSASILATPLTSPITDLSGREVAEKEEVVLEKDGYLLMPTFKVKPNWRSMYVVLDMKFPVNQSKWSYRMDEHDVIQTADIYVWEPTRTTDGNGEEVDAFRKLTAKPSLSGPLVHAKYLQPLPLPKTMIAGLNASVPHSSIALVEEEYGVGCVEQPKSKPLLLLRCGLVRNLTLLLTDLRYTIEFCILFAICFLMARNSMEYCKRQINHKRIR
jgi:hypothetical protein